MAGNVKLMTSAGGGVVLDTATTTATDVTVKVPVTGVNNGTLVCSDSSGNVGIGTSSPSQKLHIQGGFLITPSSGWSSGNTASMYLGDTGNGLATTFGGLTNLTGYYGIAYRVGGSETMRIDSSGNLLVGTTSLTASYNARFTSQSDNSIWGQNINLTTTSGTGYLMSFTRNAAVVGSITASGASSVAYNTSSDYRLKENIQPMQNALAVVQQLNPVTYTWKADGSDGQGFIAHELQAVVPDCVTGEKDAVDKEGNPVYQGIDTSFLVATLTKAIQEQQAQIETLTAKVAALEAK